ncbi:hypothetical protein Bca52824_009529 [Brassica carinata]|uniref:FKB95-like N-terminal Kelch domain-containing protein n=1 Tax=Brassica carinata TaxID=52824 RepID=A0A8X7WC27_BRACI|nr:hypothetical protein Bca52824_009529 [Brassica carinata]
MPADGILVAAGSRIYVFGRLNSVISIDFRSQTVHLLPSMNVTMSVSVAGIIDGKIYCNKPRKQVMKVFNTETQMWEPEKTTPEMMSGCMVMMAGKIRAVQHM